MLIQACSLVLTPANRHLWPWVQPLHCLQKPWNIQFTRGKAYKSSQENFGFTRCQDDVATLAHKVPCGQFMLHCLSTKLFTIACSPQHFTSPIVIFRFVLIQLSKQKKKTHKPHKTLFLLFFLCFLP